MDPILTDSDIAHLSEVLAARLSDPDDDGGPEVVMCSLGYVELWRDGEVVYGGCVVATVE